VRHVVSILLALIFAPTILVLVDIGLSGVDSARWGSFTDDPIGPLAALGMLFLAGLIYGALVMVRLSPVGPGFAGLAMMVISSWAVLDPSSYYETLGRIDVHMGGAVGQWGLGMLLGAPLVATLTSPRRWRNEEDGRSNHDPANPTHLTPALPISRTLPDMWPARPEVPEAPTVPIGTLSAPTAEQLASAGPTAASTFSPVPSGQAVPTLPRRIPMVPPDLLSAPPRTDGHTPAPVEDAAITAAQMQKLPNDR